MLEECLHSEINLAEVAVISFILETQYCGYFLWIYRTHLPSGPRLCHIHHNPDIYHSNQKQVYFEWASRNKFNPAQNPNTISQGYSPLTDRRFAVALSSRTNEILVL